MIHVVVVVREQLHITKRLQNNHFVEETTAILMTRDSKPFNSIGKIAKDNPKLNSFMYEYLQYVFLIHVASSAALPSDLET
jgi:hypothetical protein